MTGARDKTLRIGVIGNLVKDEIIAFDGRKTVALGGIAYNLAALNSVVANGTIFPFCRIGNDMDALVNDLLRQFPNLDPQFISHSRKPNRVHKLRYKKDGSRAEWNSAFTAPIAINDIPDSLDALLINFISGNDVRLKDLKTFRMRFKGIIYCDFHSLSLGQRKDGTRYLRNHPHWKEYLRYVDGIQMNLNELSTLFPITPNPEPSEILKHCMKLHELGPQIVVITMAKSGAVVSSPAAGISHYIPAIKVSREVDPTGCGDVLAGAFLYRYLRTGNILKSIEFANVRAAAKATFSGLSGFLGLTGSLKNAFVVSYRQISGTLQSFIDAGSPGTRLLIVPVPSSQA